MIFQLIIIFLLTAINAFFASAEMAMISINKNQIKIKATKGNKNAKLLLKLLEEPSKFLATIQVGITLAGFFSSAFAATNLSIGFAVLLKKLQIPYSDQIALSLITIALSFIMLLFGELFPKRVALQKAEAIAMFSIKPIYYVSIIAKPFVKLLSICTNGLIRLFGLKQNNIEQRVSEEEIMSMVKVGQELGLFNKKEKQMINSIFEFDDKLAREVMTPRIDIKMVNIDQDISKIVDEVIQLKYSRIPLYSNEKDNICGIIHVKSLLVSAKEKGFKELPIKTLMKAPYFVSEAIPIDKLFIKLQKDQQHMAILIDEHGLVTGLVTIEDLIEEIVGEIQDEFDEKKEEITLIKNNQYRVDGGLPLFDFNDFFHTNITCIYADTIGGYIINELEELPKEGANITLTRSNLIFEIETVSQHRVTSLLVSKKD